VREAIKQCNFNKGMGPDQFSGTLLNLEDPNDEFTLATVHQLTDLLNNHQEIPRYLSEGRLIPLSKNKGKDQATLNDIRPIVVRSHLAKILEKAVLSKVTHMAPELINTKRYQTGFKEGQSTAANVIKLIQQLHPGRGKKPRQYAALIDLQKAYDTVDRTLLWNMLY
jgi:Reverse transcriptase (RNA-dependent DNA polymerase)